MLKRRSGCFLALVAGFAAIAMMSCGSGTQVSTQQPPTSTPTGMLVTFGTDQPSCDVQSFLVTIQSASLVQESGGASVPITTPGQPVDFASLVDFTNIISFGSVNTGTYSQLTLTLTSPQLTYLNTSVSPPVAVAMLPCAVSGGSNCTSFSNGTATDTLNLLFSPPLSITSNGVAGLVLDFDMRDSVQTGANGQITGIVDPQITVSPSVASGTTLGEADSVYGVVQSAPTTTSSNPSFVGSFPLQVQGGVGQTITIQVTSSTTFQGDGVSGLTGDAALQDLAEGTFVEVDAIVDTSGNIIAQEVDAEAQSAGNGQAGGFLGRVIAVSRDGSGNATGFNLLIGHETMDMTSEVPLHSSLAVTVSNSTNYWTNWRHWNRDSLQFGPQTLGIAEDVAVFGTLTAASGGSPATLSADMVFLRQRNVLGTFQSVLSAGSDNKTGGFTMMPCGDLFQGHTITVLTFGDSRFHNVGGLSGLTAGPVINVAGLLFYEQQNSPAGQQPAWTGPTWVMQAKTVHQLPQ